MAREHIRIDTFKVFEEEDEILTLIMKVKKCNKSDAYREALKIWKATHILHEEKDSTKAILEEILSKQDDLYDKLNVLSK